MKASQHQKTDEFFELIKGSPIDDNELVIRLSKLIRMCKEFEQGYNRYEKLRKLNPQQFKVLWIHSLYNRIPFDELVDGLELFSHNTNFYSAITPIFPKATLDNPVNTQ